ncbi:hypothetical protein [Pseudonocardia sp. HH130630-07]|uniref:hypothetical protein n=1 Tax=Pseudonocardia sp. HH130630-07 TaxID=1690815 RepID=UPI001E4906CF|nr:hypothetical protein [Pseudonocardia sp. HH130630-07]
MTERFARDGYVHLPGAFSPELAARCRDLLAARLRTGASTWTIPPPGPGPWSVWSP